MAQYIKLYSFILALIGPFFVESISVIGPRILRPYAPYRVAIAGGARAHTLYLAIEGTKANGEAYNQGREVQIPAVTSRIVDLEVQDPGPGRYILAARSTSGPQFASSANLIYQPRSFCIFVQTDKGVYQPGDTINFRVIALDKYLLPLTGTVDVTILDAGGSPVHQWAEVPIDRGLVSSDLILADEPALGEWTIQVEARGQKYSRQILVADYVMPKWKMEMHMPKELLFSEGRFTINITAKHFNGLPVRGELTLSSYAVFFSGLLQPVFSSPARKVVEFNGQALVTYDLKTDLDLAEDAARPLVVEAVLEEKHTLVKQNVSSRILLLRTPYRLKVSAPEFFKPNLPYNVQIEVIAPSGEVMNVDGEASVERLWDDGAPKNVTSVSLKSGRGTYSVTPDKAHSSSTLNLVIQYKEVTERVVNVHSGVASDGQHLVLDLLTGGTGPGDEMRARVTSTEPMDVINYAVIARGDILVAKTLELSPARRSVDISVQVTPAMAPGCIVLAWYPHLGSYENSVLSAAVYAPQKKLLQHEVLVRIAGGGYRPGGAVEFKVIGEAGSHAALLAEDTKAITTGLASKNGLGAGLDLNLVEREVESFNGLKHSFFKNEDHLPFLGMDLGGKSSSDVFKNAGIVILTDGVVVSSIDDGTSSLHQVPETGTRPPLAGPYAFSRLPTPPSPRYYLTDTPQPTWMLTNFTLSFDGNGIDNRRSPTKSGEWTVGAFAIHPTLGLGLATKQSFATSVPLTMDAELPETLQKGETFAAIIILKSSLTVDSSVEVTFHNSEQYFEFEPLENTVDSAKKIELFRRLRVSVPASGEASTAFLVTAVKIGEAPIIVEASGNGVTASLFRTITVKDGYEEDVLTWSMLDARRGVARANITLSPAAGTKLAAISLLAAGDLLAPVLQEIRTKPLAAGDPVYALRPLALASIVLDYLKVTNRDEVAILTEAKSMAAVGYQRLMAYRKSDSSFAPDTSSDSVGDVWLTSVAMRWLARGQKYVEVSPEVAAACAHWLAQAQRSDGGWDVASPATRVSPRAQDTLAQAAYALIALLHTPVSDTAHQNAINKAIDFVARNLTPDLDAYTLTLVASALYDAKHPQASQALQLMDKYANTTGSTLFWSRKISGNEWRNPWLKENSLEAVTAAWGLKAMLAANLLDEAVPVARFLVEAYRPQHLDPDVLDALAQFAERLKTSTKIRLAVNVTGSEEPRQFSIDDDNALIVQTQVIRSARSVSAMTEGRGIALLGLKAAGSTNVTAAWPRYTLDPRVDQVSTRSRVQLSICIGFVPQGNETESGLAMLTVQLPSGYVADINTLTELTASPHVSSARLAARGSRVVAWVRARVSERCATLAAARERPVANQRPGYVAVEDLYDSSHRARVFFLPVTSHACDVCREWPSCNNACGATAQQVSSDEDDTGTNSPTGRKANASNRLEYASLLIAVTSLLFILLQ